MAGVDTTWRDLSAVDSASKNVTTRTRVVAHCRGRAYPVVGRSAHMTRIITVEDDNGTTAQITISQRSGGQIVHRVLIETNSERGLSDAIVTALLPYIGLPAARPPRPSPAPTPIAMPPRRPDRLDDAISAASAIKSPVTPPPLTRPPTPAAAFSGSNGPRPGTPAAPTPEDASPPESLPTATTPANGAKAADPPAKSHPRRRRPSNDDMAAAIRKVGMSTKDLAEYFGEEKNQTISNWLYVYRKETNAR